MECKLLRQSISVGETIYEGASEQPIDVELTLPDYCADIGKILKCYAVPRVTSRLIDHGALDVEGVTRIVVLYCSGRNEEVSCYEHELPFSAVYKLNDAPDNAKADVTAEIQYINCRAVSQRKLDIHGAFGVSVKVTAQTENDVVSDVTGAGVKIRSEKLCASSLAAVAQGAFTVSDTLEVSPNDAAIGNVVRNDVVISVGECKAIANKLVVNGTAKLTFVYCGESGEGVRHMEYAVDFNEIVDVPGIDEECVWDADIRCSGVDIGLRTDQNGEYRRMNVDIHCFAGIKAYKNTELTVAKDAYSVDYEIETERRPISLRCFRGVAKETAVAEKQLDTGDIRFSAIDDVRCDTHNVGVIYKNGRACLNGSVIVGILGKNIDNKCVYCEKTIPLECDIKTPEGMVSPRFENRTYISGCSYVLSGTGKPEVRVNVAVESAIYDEVTLSCISSVTADESRAKVNDSALVIYFADEGEYIWDIAREYNSDVDTIISENDIKDEQIKEKTMLLISR